MLERLVQLTLESQRFPGLEEFLGLDALFAQLLVKKNPGDGREVNKSILNRGPRNVRVRFPRSLEFEWYKDLKKGIGVHIQRLVVVAPDMVCDEALDSVACGDHGE
jgi:hypothetical protein